MGAEFIAFPIEVRDTLFALDTPPKLSGYTWIDQDLFSSDISRSGSQAFFAFLLIWKAEKMISNVAVSGELDASPGSKPAHNANLRDRRGHHQLGISGECYSRDLRQGITATSRTFRDDHHRRHQRDSASALSIARVLQR
jgi:hypothetical protein